MTKSNDKHWSAPVSEVHEDDLPDSYRTPDRWPAHAPGDYGYDFTSDDHPTGDGFTFRRVDLDGLREFRQWVVKRWKASEGEDQKYFAAILTLIDVFCKEQGL